ncbi:MAG: penicillin-binding transpeptidase domain-containing protein [bacterium]|nr:penicillin-binding transpeptidase domain-containing protein [bacterium]
MVWRRKKRRDPELAPDEIFLDAANAGTFDRARFAGQLEQPLPRATYLAIPIVVLIALTVLGARAAELEILQGPALAKQSANNSLAVTTLFAPRGIIEDMNGTVVADNTEGPDGQVRRRYLLPALGQIIGYVSYPKKDTSGNYYDRTETGLAGLEARYDAVLAGVNGQKLVETDALGTVRSEGSVTPAIPGATLRLSVDADLERHFASAISSVARKFGFIAGAGVIMDVHTGAVRAIVSYPSYDPNVMSGGGPASVISAYANDPGHPFLDHAVGGIYAPGSIVKPFVAAGGLSDGLITPSTVVNDTGSLSIPDPYHPGKSFLYTGWRALGEVDVRRAIAWSSDVFFYTLGGGFKAQKGLGIDRLEYWYRAFGLGTTTGVDLPGEVSGLIPTPAWKQSAFGEPWYLGDTYFTAIGQYSMQITPIQAVRATAAVANGGTLLTPTLLVNAVPTGTRVPVDSQILQVVREGMRQSVTSALASALNLPYVAVAAKTGTAQVGSRNQYDNSWVEGFFPYDAPRYAFAVVLERGPEGAGEQAVAVMRDLFISLHRDDSMYTGGPVKTTASSTGLAP